MVTHSKFVIIGGGIAGCSLLFELSRIFPGEVILVEAETIACGTTGHSGGFIRRVSESLTSSELLIDSFNYYQHFKTITGFDCGYTNTGFSYRFPEVTWTTICNNLIHNGMSDNLQWDIINDNEVIVHEHQAGRINTRLTCQNWVKAAKQLGSTYYESTKVLRILHSNNRVAGVLTNKGAIDANYVINAAGYNAPLLMRDLINEKTSNPGSFQYLIFPQLGRFYHTAYIDFIDGYYVFPLANGDVIIGFLDEDSMTQDSSTMVDEHLTNRLLTLVSKRFPWLENKSYTTRVGYDAFTINPSKSFVETSIPGLIMASGLNGGGVKITPGLTKQLIKELGFATYPSYRNPI